MLSRYSNHPYNMFRWRIAITDVYEPSSPGASRGYRAASGGQINFGIFLIFILQIIRKDLSPSKRMGYKYFLGPSKGGTSVFQFCIKIQGKNA